MTGWAKVGRVRTPRPRLGRQRALSATRRLRRAILSERPDHHDSGPPNAMPDPSSLALPHVAMLHAYTPGLQPTEPGWVKLNTNESPYPPSPRVAEAIKRDLGDDGASLRRYPNPKSIPLRAAVAH